MKSISAAVFLFLSCSPCWAQFSTQYVDGKPFTSGCSQDHCFFPVPIYITAEPHNIDKAVADCANADVCRGALVAIAAYAGMEPSSVDQALSAYGTAYPILTGNSGGNEHWIYFDAPPDFVFCTIAWHTWSVTSGSTVSGSFRHDRRQAGFYANVPVNGWLEGSSWTKTMVQLHAIRNGTSANCSSPIDSNSWGTVMFNENGGSSLSGGQFWDVNAN